MSRRTHAGVAHPGPIALAVFFAAGTLSAHSPVPQTSNADGQARCATQRSLVSITTHLVTLPESEACPNCTPPSR